MTKTLFYSLLVLYLLQSYKIEQKSEISYEKITSLVFFALVLLNTINERAIGVLL